VSSKDHYYTLGTTVFVAPVKARRPLIKQWWSNYQARDASKAANVTMVFAFHYHLRLLFPKERGIMIAYPSSLVGLAKEEYYTSRRYRNMAISVMARDGGRCRVCNTNGPLQVHHRNYSYWGNESGEELTTLCADCHELFHDSDLDLHNNGLFYVWTRPGDDGKAVPHGYTNSVRLAREEMQKHWG
jgi:hypothetical protein